ncbi:hypothetical protein EVAR_88111_1 [Eumeta japonica]|uniref:Uncharacterized protein n=1 Tax=Eumeta variegata TaxID=151549 RepID=A0A4C2A6E9_EUMVA|nr:hypothetical protein EVAR_88111_1 [Eumeta japonica]
MTSRLMARTGMMTASMATLPRPNIRSEDRKAGENEERSGSVRPVHCIIRKQFREAEFRALYCAGVVP